MLFSLLFVGLLSAVSYAAPIAESGPTLGLKFEKHGNGLPTLTLPDAVYQAAGYDVENDIYKWKNIRFAAPPVGDLRWAKPAPPPLNPVLQDGSYGPQCPQASLKGLNVLGNAAGSPLGQAIDQIAAQLLAPVTTGGSEDCLFLDIFVPGAAVRSPSTTKLPVIHWFFGGGYIFGSKDQLEPALPFYDGTGMISGSGNNVIFVASNYRLGAFGFLAGATMEQQGLPNAGLWDQRAALQWTQDHIALVGGDPTQVTAMGESAGAGSILHHLVAEGGTLAPLFSKAIMQSPAFQPAWGRREGLQSVYSQFETLAGCTGQGVACLRAASSDTLLSANHALNDDATDGTFAVGPSADGKFIRQLPALEFASGNYYKGISSVLISHVSDESTVFVDGHIATDDEFNAFVKELMPAYCESSGLNTLLEAFYPGTSTPGTPYPTESDRVRAFVRDSSFTCNTRYLATAYPSSYMLQYAVTPGWHATDLIPTFWSTSLAGNALGAAITLLNPLFSVFAHAYQSYLTSFARAGDPNAHRDWLSSVEWPVVDLSTGEEMANVLQAGDLGFSVLGGDTQNKKTACDFWVEWEAAATILGGYAPPGSVVGSGFVNASEVGGASANY
ncbi:hypothetical protein MMC30_005972 [Trapelia coarctata]|nr:hypothetical protein [Trapelia coarctata]